MSDRPVEPLRLVDHHRLILCVLDETGAMRTGDVADRAGLGDGTGAKRRRIASANCPRWLLELEAAGLVARLDDRDPIAWVCTPAGTTMLGLLA